MTRSPRTIRLLDVLSGIVLLISLGLYLWPVNVTVPGALASNESKLVAITRLITATDNDASLVVSSNILSSSRHAPSVRYTSPDLLPAPDFALPSAFTVATAADSAKTATDAPDAVPSLYGIVNADGTWRALLRLTESDASPVLLREGERRGFYLVISIRPNAVVVAGPSGQRTLRLNRASRNDSTGKSL